MGGIRRRILTKASISRYIRVSGTAPLRVNRCGTISGAAAKKGANREVIIYHRSRSARSLARCRARGSLNYFPPLPLPSPSLLPSSPPLLARLSKAAEEGIVTFFTKINRVDKRVRSLNNQSRRGGAFK